MLGGHIPGSQNLPASTFEGAVLDRFVNKWGLHEGPHKLVFHCRHSLNRAPICARAVRQQLDLLWPEHSISIAVLEFGFEGWAFKFSSNPQLVEDYIPSLWDAKLDALSPLRKKMYSYSSDEEAAAPELDSDEEADPSGMRRFFAQLGAEGDAGAPDGDDPFAPSMDFDDI